MTSLRSFWVIWADSIRPYAICSTYLDEKILGFIEVSSKDAEVLFDTNVICDFYVESAFGVKVMPEGVSKDIGILSHSSSKVARSLFCGAGKSQ